MGSPSASQGAAPSARRPRKAVDDAYVAGAGALGPAMDPLALAYKRHHVQMALATVDERGKKQEDAWRSMERSDRERLLNSTIRFCMLKYMCVRPPACVHRERSHRLERTPRPAPIPPCLRVCPSPSSSFLQGRRRHHRRERTRKGGV
jgi:hypothetical protein